MAGAIVEALQVFLLKKSSIVGILHKIAMVKAQGEAGLRYQHIRYQHIVNIKEVHKRWTWVPRVHCRVRGVQWSRGEKDPMQRRSALVDCPTVHCTVYSVHTQHIEPQCAPVHMARFPNSLHKRIGEPDSYWLQAIGYNSVISGSLVADQNDISNSYSCKID